MWHMQKLKWEALWKSILFVNLFLLKMFWLGRYFRVNRLTSWRRLLRMHITQTCTRERSSRVRLTFLRTVSRSGFRIVVPNGARPRKLGDTARLWPSMDCMVQWSDIVCRCQIPLSSQLRPELMGLVHRGYSVRIRFNVLDLLMETGRF